MERRQNNKYNNVPFVLLTGDMSRDCHISLKKKRDCHGSNSQGYQGESGESFWPFLFQDFCGEDHVRRLCFVRCQDRIRTELWRKEIHSGRLVGWQLPDGQTRVYCQQC